MENFISQARRKADVSGIFPAEHGLPSITLTEANVDPGPPTLDPLMFNDADLFLTGAGGAFGSAIETVESWIIDINRNNKPFYGVGTKGAVLNQTKEGEPVSMIELTIAYEDYVEIQNTVDEVLKKVQVGIGAANGLEFDNVLFETTPSGPSVGGDMQTITLRGETTDITVV